MGEGTRERFQTLQEIVRAARETLDPGAWDYLAGGTETETTLQRNRQALDSIAFRPRVLRNVSKVDTTATLLGRTLRLPVMLAPVGSIETFTPGGAATAARGATAFGVAGPGHRHGLPGGALVGSGEALQGHARRAAVAQGHRDRGGRRARVRARRGRRLRLQSRRATARPRPRQCRRPPGGPRGRAEACARRRGWLVRAGHRRGQGRRARRRLRRHGADRLL